MMRFLNRQKFILSLSMAVLLGSMSAFAANDKPLEIRANENLEWNEQAKTYTARGKAVAAQPEQSITADELKAEYTDQNKVSRITASGNVNLQKGNMTGTSNKAVYDMEQNKALMNGGNLSIRTPDKTITATDEFNYNLETGEIQAIGNAILTSGAHKITADKLIAFVDKTNNQLLRAEAVGHVVITAPQQTATSLRATYDAKTNIVQLFDQVVVTQGVNVLTGTRAEVNLNTNVSRMFGGAATGTRVKAVFYPQ